MPIEPLPPAPPAPRRQTLYLEPRAVAARTEDAQCETLTENINPLFSPGRYSTLRAGAEPAYTEPRPLVVSSHRTSRKMWLAIAITILLAASAIAVGVVALLGSSGGSDGGSHPAAAEASVSQTGVAHRVAYLELLLNQTNSATGTYNDTVASLHQRLLVLESLVINSPVTQIISRNESGDVVLRPEPGGQVSIEGGRLTVDGEDVGAALRELRRQAAVPPPPEGVCVPPSNGSYPGPVTVLPLQTGNVDGIVLDLSGGESISLSPSHAHVAISGSMYNFSSGQRLWNRPSSAKNGMFSADCRYFVDASHTSWRLYDVATGQILRNHNTATMLALRAAISNDNRFVYTYVTSLGHLTKWDVASTDVLKTYGSSDIGTSTSYTQDFVLTKDQKYLVAIYANNLYLYSEATGGKITSWSVTGSSFTAVAVNDAGTLVATGRVDGVVEVRSLPGSPGVYKNLERTHSGRVVDMAFAPDGRLVTIGADNKIKLWDMHTMTLQQNFLDQTNMQDLDVTDGYIGVAANGRAIVRLLPPPPE